MQLGEAIYVPLFCFLTVTRRDKISYRFHCKNMQYIIITSESSSLKGLKKAVKKAANPSGILCTGTSTINSPWFLLYIESTYAYYHTPQEIDTISGHRVKRNSFRLREEATRLGVIADKMWRKVRVNLDGPYRQCDTYPRSVIMLAPLDEFVRSKLKAGFSTTMAPPSLMWIDAKSVQALH